MKNSAARKSGPSLRIVSEPRQPRAPRAKKPLGVVAQVKVACKPGNRLAAFMGALLGGFVPLASYMLAHHEARELVSVPALLVAGGLVFSAKTVVDWARLAFDAPMKAVGFVVLLEGVMVASRTEWLAIAALAYLIGINAVATGCKLAVRR